MATSLGKSRKLIFEVYDICIISCVGLVEEAINLPDFFINQRDITFVKSIQEVDLHKSSLCSTPLPQLTKGSLSFNTREDKFVAVRIKNKPSPLIPCY